MYCLSLKINYTFTVFLKSQRQKRNKTKKTYQLNPWFVHYWFSDQTIEKWKK